MRTYKQLIEEIDRKLQEEFISNDELLPGTQYIELGMHGIKKMYGICKAKDFKRK